MAIELKMPALSPTMEEGTLAKWLKQEGDSIVAGDIIAEIETDKATMEFEAVDELIGCPVLVPERVAQRDRARAIGEADGQVLDPVAVGIRHRRAKIGQSDPGTENDPVVAAVVEDPVRALAEADKIGVIPPLAR